MPIAFTTLLLASVQLITEYSLSFFVLSYSLLREREVTAFFLHDCLWIVQDVLSETVELIWAFHLLL
jgi:hypothetical protein